MRSEPGRGSLRLCLVTETYPPEINGVANTLRHLLEGLEERGHEVHLIRPRQKAGRAASAHGAGATADDPGCGHRDRFPRPGLLPRGDVAASSHRYRGSSGHRCHVTLVPGLPIPGYPDLRFGLPVYRRLRRLWRDVPPDALYIATQGPLGHAALAAARASGIPTVTGFHTQFHQYSGHYGLGLLAYWIVRILRAFHNRSDATLVPTEQLRTELAGLGFQRVRVLGRGVDTKLFDPRRRREDLRRSWGCPPGGKVVLSVGRLAAEKNLELAIQAFAEIAAKSPDTKLVLVGDGPWLEPLRRSHPDLALTGAKVGVELAEHFASADLFLFPSLTETFGNVVPEAMASGLVVIGFDYGAAGVCIRSWENGVKVPKGDDDAFRKAAATAVRDEARRRTMGECARATAEGMSWGRITADLEDLLLEVIERHRTEHRNESLAATTE